MSNRNFVVTVKERQGNEPCFLVFELDEPIGLGDRQSIVFDLPGGTDINDAKEYAKQLNAMNVKIMISNF